MNRFYISYEKELLDNLVLIEKIKEAKFMDSNTIIVNCNPDYSSSLVQLVNHKLSYLNNNELYEVLNLQIPSEDMSQVWHSEEREYVRFDSYLGWWMWKFIDTRNKYLFVSSFIGSGRAYRKILSQVKADFLTSSTYLAKDSDWKPMFHVEQYDREILFEWQNSNKNNKNE
jgi:hypothetical protein